ncbi:Aspartic proteinase nepenthesin-1 [Rhynchospora pubera]|uniref:Aspartic proteinase nepenthesin-1 n=1 Tax=Rhynchospora pubera TaxID=906938 RepID=A0AAV8CD71_9POAL|nr:Aspartic proteinase nepenthesin-1 [Rhynchospora pubera]
MQKIAFILLLLSVCTSNISLSYGIRTELTHIDAGTKYTKLELLQRMVQRTKTRARFLASRYTDPTSQVSVPSSPSNGEYLINLSIGIPAQPLALTLDTGSDLIWTQCQPCLQCFSQPLPLYDPSNSSTFSDISCDSDLCQSLPHSACHKQCMYAYSYGDGSLTVGSLGSETFTLGSTQIQKVGFGCGFLNAGIFRSNESGIAGFGRGPLSLISQLGYGKFSYCFTSFGESKSSPVLFGSAADLNNWTSGKVQSTPLVTNPAVPTLYYLTLTGITVGMTLLEIPKSTFSLKDNGTGGVYIDSGTGMTQLAEPAYKQVKLAFLSQMKLPIANSSIDAFDLCFRLPSSSSDKVEVPKFTFHFEDADLELPTENYMAQDPDNSAICLVMGKSLDGSTVIGNFQQQNVHILYDLERSKLSFVPARCDQL